MADPSRVLGILAHGHTAERPADVRPIPGTLLVVLGILVLCGWLVFGGPAVLLLGDQVSPFPFAFGLD
ncbi:MAG TPA: hypothetical protein VGK63_10285 [Candidatus Limnocylindrales bacterium]